MLLPFRPTFDRPTDEATVTLEFSKIAYPDGQPTARLAKTNKLVSAWFLPPNNVAQ